MKKRKMSPQLFFEFLKDLKNEIDSQNFYPNKFSNKHHIPYLWISNVRKMGYYAKTKQGYIWTSSNPTEKDGLKVFNSFYKARKPINAKHSKKKAKKNKSVKKIKIQKINPKIVSQETTSPNKYLSFIKRMLQNKTKDELIELLLTYI